MLLHRRKIPVVMEQRVATLDAQRADDEVRGLADPDAEISQLAILPRGTRREIDIQQRHEDILPQPPSDVRRIFVPSP